MPAFNNITGLRFGRLVALRPEGKNKRGTWRWRCQCDCGNTALVQNPHLTNGHTKSCGCLNREVIAARKTTLGERRTKASWRAMRERCCYPRHKDYKNYGGRGVKVRFPSVEAIVADMGECPPGHDCHRLDNDGDYEPGNCVWLPREEHMRLHATRRTKYVPRLLDGPSPK